VDFTRPGAARSECAGRLAELGAGVEGQPDVRDGPRERHVTIRETVRHSAKEYVWGDVHTNSAEGYFGLLKRGMKGIYQHCKEKHLHRYLAEYDFRYNHRVKLGVDDAMRAERAQKGVVGKRLTYGTIGAR
jgi:hypothetical protein